jgi:hypothetical protein
VLKGAGAASLKVVIKPAEETANARAANYSYGVPGLTQPGGLGYYNYLRKPASDFGWDWGPAFTPAGIYGSVQLQAYSGAFLTGAQGAIGRSYPGCLTQHPCNTMSMAISGIPGTTATWPLS